MNGSLDKRLKKLEAVAIVDHPREIFTDEERERRLNALLEDYIGRGYLVITDSGRLAAGANFPEEPSHERSIALFFIAAIEVQNGIETAT